MKPQQTAYAQSDLGEDEMTAESPEETLHYPGPELASMGVDPYQWCCSQR
jgi:hypothetical protein